MDTFAAAKDAIAQKDWDKARQLLEPLIAERPGGVPALFMARTLLETGEIDRAEKVLTPFVEKHPDHLGAHLVTGEIHMARGDYARARATVQAVLDTEPDQARAAGIMAEIEKREIAQAAHAHIALIDAATDADRRTDPAPELLDAARALAALPRIEGGTFMPVIERINHFNGAATPEAALAEYGSFLTTLKQREIRATAGGFDEDAFQDDFNRLIRAEKPEDALSLLISELPKISGSRINRKEKLKHLTFAGRRLQHAGLGKYGIEKVKRKAAIALETLKEFPPERKSLFVDFGCGAHEPLALAAYFYANGFDKCIANDFLPIRAPEYAAVSMYDVLVQMKAFPEDFVALGQTPEKFLRALGRFDPKACLDGDFEAGLGQAGKDVQFLSCDIVDSGLKPDSVSYLVSFAVFEHVLEIDKVCAYLFDVTEPGGVHHHFIDLADHRAYRHDGMYNQFSFLTEDAAAPNLNRLRASEQRTAFERAGFEILKAKTVREDIPDATRAAFLPRWQQMSPDDQEAVSMTLVVRKPK